MVNVKHDESDSVLINKLQWVSSLFVHGAERQAEGATDSHRSVGDANKVAQEGRQFTDTATGNTVHVKGNKVVITDGNGKKVTQFKNTKKNTQQRIKSGKWEPKT